MAEPFISACIITGGRLALLDACLASLQAQRDAPSFEVIVCSNGGPDAGPVVRKRFADASVGRLSRAHPGAARNFVIERATGTWLLFLDDDVVVGPNMLGRLAKLATAYPNVAVLGGPNYTPGGSSRFQLVQGAVLSSIVASGPVRRRYGPHPAGPADERFFTLCNLAVRRDAMLPFPDDLLGGEENAVLSEMSRRGMRMRYDPDLKAFHERRPTLRQFASQMFKYGRGRGQVLRRQPRSVRAPYLAAPALLLGLPVAAALTIVSPLAAIPLALYLAAVMAGALRIAWKMRWAGAAALGLVQILVLHACYGTGTMRGLFDRRRPLAGRPQVQWEHREPSSMTTR